MPEWCCAFNDLWECTAQATLLAHPVVNAPLPLHWWVLSQDWCHTRTVRLDGGSHSLLQPLSLWALVEVQCFAMSGRLPTLQFVTSAECSKTRWKFFGFFSRPLVPCSSKCIRSLISSSAVQPQYCCQAHLKRLTCQWVQQLCGGLPLMLPLRLGPRGGFQASVSTAVFLPWQSSSPNG